MRMAVNREPRTLLHRSVRFAVLDCSGSANAESGEGRHNCHGRLEIVT